MYASALTPARILVHYQQGILNRPTAAVTFPAAGARYSTATWNAGCGSGICGTAADANGSVASVAVSVRQSSTGLFFNGTSFASTAWVLLAATGTASWARSFPATNFATDGTYVVTAVATDNGGHEGGVNTSFIIDRTAPVAAMTFPTGGGTYNTTSWNAGCTSRICGTASDAEASPPSWSASVRDRATTGTARPSPVPPKCSWP